jgi:DNA polymerase-3 subunit delta
MANLYLDIINDLKKRIFKPVYYLYGSESYFIDAITDYIQHQVLQDFEKDFNLTVFYGLDANVGKVVDAARRYPVGATHNIVIVREAQHLRTDEEDSLQKYLEKPTPSTILVLASKSEKNKHLKKLSSEARKQIVEAEFKKLYESEIPAWIKNYLAAHRYNIEEEALQMLAEYTGTEIEVIVNECSKLFLNLKEGTTIRPEHIEEFIGISKEYSIYELFRHLANKNRAMATRIAMRYAADAREYHPVRVAATLFPLFYKVWLYHLLPVKTESHAAAVLGINRFFLKDYLAAARNYPPGKCNRILRRMNYYDLRAKGVDNQSTSPGEITREMILYILSV